MMRPVHSVARAGQGCRSWTPGGTPGRGGRAHGARVSARRPSADLGSADLGIPIIPGRLYWQCRLEPPPSREEVFYFCVDAALVYEPFFADFGPLSLGQTYRYCQLLEKYLSQPDLENKVIVHYCSMDRAKRANAAVLMVLYRVLVDGLSAEDACRPFDGIEPPLAPYRDATCGVCHYQVVLRDCAAGLEEALKHGWFDYRHFDVEEFEFMEKVESGDRSWIVPGKFLAFAGPHAKLVDEDGFPVWTPEKYAPHFKASGIGLVIRLNHKIYDASRFVNNGIRHLDLYFVDGSCPSADIVQRFFDAVTCERSAIAVHCKAGLGRTGTLIGLWCMQEVGFPARAFIAWCRLCRPGSILGPQQQYLCEMESNFISLPVRNSFRAAGAPSHKDIGRVSRDTRESSEPRDVSRDLAASGALLSIEAGPTTPPRPWSGADHRGAHGSWGSSSPSYMSPVGMYGDKGQGERLCNAKRAQSRNSGSPASPLSRHSGSPPSGPRSPARSRFAPR